MNTLPPRPALERMQTCSVFRDDELVRQTVAYALALEAKVKRQENYISQWAGALDSVKRRAEHFQETLAQSYESP